MPCTRPPAESRKSVHAVSLSSQTYNNRREQSPPHPHLLPAHQPTRVPRTGDDLRRAIRTVLVILVVNMRIHRHILPYVPALAGSCLLLLLAFAACSNGQDDNDVNSAATASPTATSTPEPTPAPPSFQEASFAFETFVEAVLADDLDSAWSLYSASVPGTTQEHIAEMGCEFNAFGNEFPRIGNMISREAPFEVVEFFGGASSTSPVEITVLGATDMEFLITLLRVQPHESYRLRFMNNGQVSSVAGAPDPLPSPDDPRGFCNIWTGIR